MKRLIILAIALSLLAACAKNKETTGQGVTFTSPSPSEPDPKVGGSLLDFTAPKLGGGRVVGSEYVSKDVAIWFWAPW